MFSDTNGLVNQHSQVFASYNWYLPVLQSRNNFDGLPKNSRPNQSVLYLNQFDDQICDVWQGFADIDQISIRNFRCLLDLLIWWIEISGKQGFVCVYTPEFCVVETFFPLLHCCEMLTVQVPSTIWWNSVENGMELFATFHRSPSISDQTGKWALEFSLAFLSAVHMTWGMVVLLFFMAGWEMQRYLWEQLVQLSIAASREMTYWRTPSLCRRDNLLFNVLLIEGSD